MAIIILNKYSESIEMDVEEIVSFDWIVFCNLANANHPEELLAT